MGMIQNAFKSSYFGLFTGTFNNQSRPSTGIRPFGSSWFYPVGAFNYWGVDDFVSDAMCIPEVAAIVGLLGNCFSNGILMHANEKGEEIDSPLNKVLKNPNWFQSQKEFLRQTKTFHSIFGNEYIKLNLPFAFDPVRSLEAMFTLPDNIVKCEYRSREPFWEHSEQPSDIYYAAKVNGIHKQLPTDTIIHINDNNIIIKDGTDKDLLKGEPKLKSLKPNTTNMKLAYESRGVILKNRGALGLLANDTKDNTGGMVPVDPDEEDKIQARMRGYGSLTHQDQILVTNNNYKWVEMAIRPDKLGLFEETREDFNKCLDIFNVSGDLFVREKGSTYENQNEARKGLYESNIIPAANEWTAALNRRLTEGKREKIIMSYTHLPLFQEDAKLKGEALSTTVNALTVALADNQITSDEYKEELRKLGVGRRQQR